MAEVKNKKMIVIDCKDDEARRKEASGLKKFCQEINNSNISKYVSRIVMAVHDFDSNSICNVPLNETRNYAMIEIFGDNLDMSEKIVKAFITSHKYKVAGSKKFNNKEYPVCKLIVKFQ